MHNSEYKCLQYTKTSLAHSRAMLKHLPTYFKDATCNKLFSEYMQKKYL